MFSSCIYSRKSDHATQSLQLLNGPLPNMDLNAAPNEAPKDRLTALNDVKQEKNEKSGPESILRSSGSSNCLKQSSSRCTLQSCPVYSDESIEQQTVTVINSKSLPNYSTERYYMLSELEMKAHSISYLSDWNDGEDLTQFTSSCSSASSLDGGNTTPGLAESTTTPNNNRETEESLNVDCDEQQDSKLLPPAIILYLLWPSSCIQYTNPHSFAQGPINNCVQAIIQRLEQEKLSLQATTDDNRNDIIFSSPGTKKNANESKNGRIKRNRIYVIVDRVIAPNSTNQEHSEESNNEEPNLMDTDQEGRQKHSKKINQNDYFSIKSEIAMAEALAKSIAKSNLRSVIEGVTVGVSSSLRAAPGLEACLNAIFFCEPERRFFSKQYQSEFSEKDDPKRSCIGIVTPNPEQIMGMDESRETDAVQNLSLHHLICAEWSGYGDLNSFAARAQKMWRRQYTESYYDDDKNDEDFDDVDSLAHAVSGTSRQRSRKRSAFSKNSSRNQNPMVHQVEFISNIMVTIFLLIFWSHIWVTYGKDFIDMFWGILAPTQFNE